MSKDQFLSDRPLEHNQLQPSPIESERYPILGTPKIVLLREVLQRNKLKDGRFTYVGTLAVYSESQGKYYDYRGDELKIASPTSES